MGSGLEIDTSEALSIFTLLDADGNDQVSLDEFIAGAMKLKGHARSVDVLTLMYDSARHNQKFNRFCAHVEDELIALRRHLDAEYKPHRRSFVEEEIPSFSELRSPARLSVTSMEETD